MSFYTTENFNAENFNFKLKVVDGKQQIKLTSKDGKLAIVNTPFMIFPFPVSSYAKSKGSTDTITDWTLDIKASCYETLDLKTIDYDYGKNSIMIKKLFGEFEKIQNMLTDFAVENSVKLFKKELKREIIEEAYVAKFIKKNDKKDPDGNSYPDRITTKIMKSIKTGNPDIIIEDFEENSIPIESWNDIETKVAELIPKGTPGRSIIMLRPYLVNGKLGMTIKLCAVQVDDKKKNAGSNVFTFRSGPSSFSAQKPTENVAAPKAEETVVDSEEEEEEEEDDEGSEVDVEES
jgi:hypothetical protein